MNELPIQGPRLTWNTVNHSSFKRCLDEIMRVHASYTGPYAEGVRIVGCTGLGKTELAKAAKALLPDSGSRFGTRRRVLYVEVPPAPTRKAVLVAMLQALGDRLPNWGTVNAMEMRVLALLKEAQVELLIFDEVQHFVLQGSKVAMSVAADTFKRLINLAELPIVLMGAPSSSALFTASSQLRSRVGPELRLDAFSWDDEVQRMHFLSVIKAQFPLGFENDSFMFLPDVALRFWYATYGVPRAMRKMIFKLDQLRISSKLSKLDLPLLSTAFKAALWPYAPPNRNPFEGAFEMNALIRDGEPWERDPMEGGHHDQAYQSVAAAAIRRSMQRIPRVAVTAATAS
ncbi:MAG: TniB family NTP-binding protein [Burkholderiaceae bacterium]